MNSDPGADQNIKFVGQIYFYRKNSCPWCTCSFLPRTSRRIQLSSSWEHCYCWTPPPQRVSPFQSIPVLVLVLHCFWILGFSYCTDDEEWRGRTEAATLWNNIQILMLFKYFDFGKTCLSYRRIFLSVVNCRILLRIIWLPDDVRTLFVVTRRSARRQNWDLFMMLVCVLVVMKSWELLTLVMSHSTLSCHQPMISLLSLSSSIFILRHIV